MSFTVLVISDVNEEKCHLLIWIQTLPIHSLKWIEPYDW